MPARSTARTLKVWLRLESPASFFGDAQAAKAAPSRLHWNLAPGSEVKEKLAVVFFVLAGGPAVMVVSGGVASPV